MKKEIKEHRIYFRMDSTMLKQLDELGERLKLNRAQTLRLSLDEAIGKHTHPGHRGAVTAIGTQQLDTLLMSLHNRIQELDPKAQSARRAKEAEKAAKRVDELRKQGKSAEAHELLRGREKKGLATGYVTWPESPKGELSPEEKEKMLDERYPGRKKK